jgi:hypothetical protein
MHRAIPVRSQHPRPARFQSFQQFQAGMSIGIVFPRRNDRNRRQLPHPEIPASSNSCSHDGQPLTRPHGAPRNSPSASHAPPVFPRHQGAVTFCFGISISIPGIVVFRLRRRIGGRYFRPQKLTLHFIQRRVFSSARYSQAAGRHLQAQTVLRSRHRRVRYRSRSPTEVFPAHQLIARNIGVVISDLFSRRPPESKYDLPA